jgi:hypothetical protein
MDDVAGVMMVGAMRFCKAKRTVTDESNHGH